MTESPATTIWRVAVIPPGRQLLARIRELIRQRSEPVAEAPPEAPAGEGRKVQLCQSAIERAFKAAKAEKVDLASLEIRVDRSFRLIVRDGGAAPIEEFYRLRPLPTKEPRR